MVKLRMLPELLPRVAAMHPPVMGKGVHTIYWGCLKKNQIILIEGSHALTSDHDTTTLGSRHGRRAAMSNSLPITASNASI